MQIGLTWPLQRLLRCSVPYGEPVDRGRCWDAHCITLHGRASLLLVHCESRYTCVRFDLSPQDWQDLTAIVHEEIRLGLLDAGVEEHRADAYLAAAESICFTRTHGRREVGFLNRAWEDVLRSDWLVDLEQGHQFLLGQEVNSRPCRCAGRGMTASAKEHLEHWLYGVN